MGAVLLVAAIFVPGQSIGQTGSSCVTTTASSPGTLEVSDLTPEQGQTVTVSGGSFTPNQSIPIRLDSTLLTTATASSTGALSASVTIPASTTTGSHTLTASAACGTGTRTLSRTITVGEADGDDTVPATGVLSVSDRTPEQGQTITASGSGFAANASVPITIQSHLSLLATGTANANGALSVSVLIPSSTELGAHTLTARGNRQGGGIRTLTADITVVAPGGTTTTPRQTTTRNTLPKTGTPLAVALATIASAMLVSGFVLRGWSRQNRTPSDHVGF